MTLSVPPKGQHSDNPGGEDQGKLPLEFEDGKPLPEELAEAVRRIPPELRDQFKGKEASLFQVIARTSLSVTTSTFPPPEYFKAIEGVIPGGAERILTQFEE